MAKYFKEISKHLLGDKELAAQYLGIARGLLGSLKAASANLYQNTRHVTLPDGTKITVSFAGALAQVSVLAGRVVDVVASQKCFVQLARIYAKDSKRHKVKLPNTGSAELETELKPADVIFYHYWDDYFTTVDFNHLYYRHQIQPTTTGLYTICGKLIFTGVLWGVTSKNGGMRLSIESSEVVFRKIVGSDLVCKAYIGSVTNITSMFKGNKDGDIFVGLKKSGEEFVTVTLTQSISGEWSCTAVWAPCPGFQHLYVCVQSEWYQGSQWFVLGFQASESRPYMVDFVDNEFLVCSKVVEETYSVSGTETDDPRYANTTYLRTLGGTMEVTDIKVRGFESVSTPVTGGYRLVTTDYALNLGNYDIRYGYGVGVSQTTTDTKQKSVQRVRVNNEQRVFIVANVAHAFGLGASLTTTFGIVNPLPAYYGPPGSGPESPGCYTDISPPPTSQNWGFLYTLGTGTYFPLDTGFLVKDPLAGEPVYLAQIPPFTFSVGGLASGALVRLEASGVTDVTAQLCPNGLSPSNAAGTPGLCYGGMV